jgi:hypothetical protein
VNKKASNNVKKVNDTLDSKKNKNSSITTPPSSDHAYSKKLTPSDKKNKETSSIVLAKKITTESTSNATSNISNKTPSKIHYDPNLNLNEKPNSKKKAQTPKTDKKLINQTKKPLKATTTEEIKKQQVLIDSFKIPKLNENTEDNIENKTEPPSRPNNEISKESSPLKSTKVFSKATNEIPKETLDKTVALSIPLKSDSNIKKTLPEKLLQKAITNSKNVDKKSNDKTKIKLKENVSSSILENLNNPLITNNISEKVKQSVFKKTTPKTAPSILTLATFEAQHKEFNANIGIKNFFNNPLILIQNYVNKLMYTQNLNFALLNSNLPNVMPQDNVFNVNYELNRDEKIELRNLMSENAGKINVFDLYQFGESMAMTKSWWNEFKPNEKVSSEEFRKRALFETLRECPILFCYQFYCAFRERNSTPFRHVDTYWSGIKQNLF